MQQENIYITLRGQERENIKIKHMNEIVREDLLPFEPDQGIYSCAADPLMFLLPYPPISEIVVFGWIPSTVCYKELMGVYIHSPAWISTPRLRCPHLGVGIIFPKNKIMSTPGFGYTLPVWISTLGVDIHAGGLKSMPGRGHLKINNVHTQCGYRRLR